MFTNKYIFPLLFLATFCGPATAAVISASENAALFGNLNQNDTNCGNVACGPTAAVNSFVFLENAYPTIYGNSLVPLINGNTFYQDEVAAANVLSGANYMSTCNCVGTYIEDFIMGKQNYINALAPNTTTYAAQISIPWLVQRNPGPQPSTNAPQPIYVQASIAPTAQFIQSQIKDGEDVEVFVGYNAGGAHYLTLTGISFDTVAMTGTISFIDPGTGAYNTANSTGVVGGVIQTNYGGGQGAAIYAAVAESPVPEIDAASTANALALLLGVLALLTERRRSRSNVTDISL